jgi:hypothetical protein
MGEGAGVVADRRIRGVPNVDGKDFLGAGLAEGMSSADISSHLMVTMSVFVAHWNVSLYLGDIGHLGLTVTVDPLPDAHWTIPLPPDPAPMSCTAFRSSVSESTCLYRSLILNCLTISPLPTSYALTTPSIVIEKSLSWTR